jgi:hypothetical protein
MKAIKTIKAIDEEAMIFVVPNEGYKVSDMYESARRDWDVFCDLNGYRHLQDDDVMIQVWITSTDHEVSENFYDHGFNVLDEKGNILHLYSRHMGHIPYYMISELKEGESKTLRFPISSDDRFSDNHDIILNLKLTANQKGYRYSGWSTFEYCMNTMIPENWEKWQKECDERIARIKAEKEKQEEEERERKRKEDLANFMNEMKRDGESAFRSVFGF